VSPRRYGSGPSLRRSLISERFAERLAELELKPKHAGLLVVLDAGLAASQLEVAKIMRVAPSFVVSPADHLEGMGALQRVRDPADRRRQVLTLTDEGRELLAECTAVARALDAEVLDGLAPEEEAALRCALQRVGATFGLPGEAS
jgi:DNA-binding MarR family transcriptional regulator